MDGAGNRATAMEGAAGIATVNELLLQSHSHSSGIQVFPQVPHGHNATFHNLRARGGFLVSASISSEQLVSGMRITNDAKDGSSVSTVRMLSPWWPGSGTVTVIEVNTKDEVPATMQAGGWFVFPAKNGESYFVGAV